MRNGRTNPWRRFTALAAFVTLWLGTACAVPRNATVRSSTERSAAIMLQALDSEALFTLSDGRKPVSEGFWHTQVAQENPDLDDLLATRAALAPWRNETLWADVHVFHEPHDGHRAARAYVVDRAALARLLRVHAAFFAPFGLAPDTHPAEVIAVIERLPVPDRHRGLGLLFGYPAHAIDFFVDAERLRREGGTVPPRRFVQIPTFVAAQGRFVYAVAESAPEHPADRELASVAATRLARYRTLRATADLQDPDALQALVDELRREFGAR